MMKRKLLLIVLLASVSATGLSAIDRGLGNPGSVYIPKGTVGLSLAGGYNSWKATGEDLDKGAVLIFLSDHEGQFVVKPPENLVDYENDPTIIGYGKILFEKDMTEYEKFHVDITYRSDRTPTMITIVTTSSAYGDYFTGASGSVIYFDELKLLY